MPEYPEENIRDVFRPAIISVTSALELFRASGIKDIVIPTYFPLRWESHAIQHRYSDEAERIQNVTTNRFIRLFRRIVEQIDGIEITEFPDNDGFMRLRFTDPTKRLASNNPILEEILENLSGVKIQNTTSHVKR